MENSFFNTLEKNNNNTLENNTDNVLVEDLLENDEEIALDRESDCYEELYKKYKATLLELINEFNKEERQDYEEMGLTDNQIEKVKIKYIKRELKHYKEIEEDALVTEDMADKFFEALKDSLTGLERREGLFKKMDVELKKIFGDTSELSSEEQIELFLNSDQDFSKVNIYAMMGDVSYLSLANEDGHYVGDSLLKYAGKKVKESILDSYRHGGDEFTALLKGEKDDINKKIEEFRKEFSEKKDVANFARYQIDPNIDIGVAKFSEGFKVFKEVLKTEVGRERLKKEKVMEEFKDIWLDIADKRAAINKAKERILLFLDAIENDKKDIFKIDGIRKGAYKITDEEIYELYEKVKAEGGDDAPINNFIISKEIEIVNNQDKEYDRIKALAIARAVGIEVLN